MMVQVYIHEDNFMILLYMSDNIELQESHENGENAQIPATASDTSINSLTNRKWSYNFYVSAGLSVITMGIGTSLIFVTPFANSAILGCSMISSTLAYWMKAPSAKE